ncbi:hypothetical protein F5Y11DRAFT_344743 [Daldinia sp. FL1419]|nr:hypothetical protein F5Y11DRAFT_344743 [Daldinia sp. FL1419]
MAATTIPMQRLFVISARNIDPARLSGELKTIFGRGGYRIEMRHSTYKVYGNSTLTEDDFTQLYKQFY